MMYGRTAKGLRWHMLDGDAPLCGVRCVLVKRQDGGMLDREGVCKNCDEALRDRGKDAARAAVAARPPPSRDVYEPKNRFRE